MTLMKAKKPLALLLALLAALSLLGTTALAAGLPEETIAAQTELCGEDCGHTHEEVFSHTEHTEESLWSSFSNYFVIPSFLYILHIFGRKHKALCRIAKFYQQFSFGKTKLF